MTRLTLITLLLMLPVAANTAAQDPTSRHLPFVGIQTTLGAGTPVPVQVELQDENGAVIFTEPRTVTPYGGGSGVGAAPAAGGAIDVLFGDQTPGGLDPAHFLSGSSRYVDVRRNGISVLRFGRMALFGAPFAVSGGGGGGTVTQVDSGFALTGGPITTTGTLSLDTTVTDGRYARLGQTVTQVNSGTGLIGGPITSAGTLSLDAAFTDGRYAQLGAANTFTGNQTINGQLTVGGTATAGTINTATEYQAGGNRVLAVSGKTNLFVGLFAGPGKTTGEGNIFVGASAGANNTTGNFNTFLGQAAGGANTEGELNTFFGYLAGSANVTGSYNAFYGAEAGKATTGFGNAFFGAFAGAANTQCCNAFFGYRAGVNNSIGGNNAFFGHDAGIFNTEGGQNTFLGNAAGMHNTTGFENVFIGWLAGQGTATASRNTYIGSWANGSSDLSNATAIGYNARVLRSNSIVLGNGANVGIGTSVPDNILTIEQNSATDPIADGWTTYSSRRWKTNIHTIEDALGKVARLRGVTFDWQAGGKHDLGFIAEEVGAVLPELVAYEDNGTDARSLDYARLTALLVEAVKEQQRQIDALRAELRRRNTRR